MSDQRVQKLQMVNPSPIRGFEIKTGELAGTYMAPVITLDKGIRFEQLSGLKYISYGWWQDLSGISAFLFILVTESKKDLDWDSFTKLVDLYEVDVILDKPEGLTDDEDPFDPERVAEEILARYASASNDTD